MTQTDGYLQIRDIVASYVFARNELREHITHQRQLCIRLHTHHVQQTVRQVRQRRGVGRLRQTSRIYGDNRSEAVGIRSGRRRHRLRIVEEVMRGQRLPCSGVISGGVVQLSVQFLFVILERRADGACCATLDLMRGQMLTRDYDKQREFGRKLSLTTHMNPTAKNGSESHSPGASFGSGAAGT